MKTSKKNTIGIVIAWGVSVSPSEEKQDKLEQKYKLRGYGDLDGVLQLRNIARNLLGGGGGRGGEMMDRGEELMDEKGECLMS